MTALRILAIDGAGPVAVAACEAGASAMRLLAETSRQAGGDADLLAVMAGDCLASAGWRPSELDVIACAVGPGGFTSIRVAVALARGLALAAARPVLAVTRFETVAHRARRQGRTGPIRVVVPGGRGSWFVQDVTEAGTMSGDPVVLAAPPDSADGTTTVDATDAGLTTGADDVARVAAARLAAGERPIAGTALLPLYLRGADAREGAGRSLLATAGL